MRSPAKLQGRGGVAGSWQRRSSSLAGGHSQVAGTKTHAGNYARNKFLQLVLMLDYARACGLDGATHVEKQRDHKSIHGHRSIRPI